MFLIKRLVALSFIRPYMTDDRQGNDEGTQYRSIVLYHGETQLATVKEIMREVDRDQW